MSDTSDVTKLTRKNDPEGNKEDILEIASEEFANHGLAGARVDAIAERTKTSKRMIYYYFGSKEELYLSVLERAYRKIRLLEENLQLGGLPPETAMRRLIEATFDHDDANPDFVRLVNIENIHRGEHMQRSQALRDLNVSVIQTIADILERGHRDGVFKRQVDPVDLHMMISSQCFFRVSNRHTFGTIFRRDLAADELKTRHKAMIVESVLSYLRSA